MNGHRDGRREQGELDKLALLDLGWLVTSAYRARTKRMPRRFGDGFESANLAVGELGTFLRTA